MSIILWDHLIAAPFQYEISFYFVCFSWNFKFVLPELLNWMAGNPQIKTIKLHISYEI